MVLQLFLKKARNSECHAVAISSRCRRGALLCYHSNAMEGHYNAFIYAWVVAKNQ